MEHSDRPKTDFRQPIDGEYLDDRSERVLKGFGQRGGCGS